MTNIETNYFTTIEDHFRVARGTGMFILSPRDVALIKAWKEADIPIEAVLRGIDVVFKKRRERPGLSRTQPVNSIAYCTQAIVVEAQAMANVAPITRQPAQAPFSLDEVQAYVTRNAAALNVAGQGDLAYSLAAIDLTALYSDLEKLEQEIIAIEDELLLRLRKATSESRLSELRRELDGELKPYRGKMSEDQITTLEKKFLDRRLLESASLPRLSLFYL